MKFLNGQEKFYYYPTFGLVHVKKKKNVHLRTTFRLIEKKRKYLY